MKSQPDLPANNFNPSKQADWENTILARIKPWNKRAHGILTDRRISRDTEETYFEMDPKDLILADVLFDMLMQTARPRLRTPCRRPCHATHH